MKRKSFAVPLYSILILCYLGFLLYFLTLRPGGASGNIDVIRAVICFASGGMVMMAIYAGTLYLFRRAEKAALWFAFLCVGAGMHFLVMEGSAALMTLVPNLSNNTLIVIRFFIIDAAVAGIACFIFEVFASPKHKKNIWVVIFLLISLFLFTSISSIVSGSMTLSAIPIILITAGVFAYCIFIVAISDGLRENKLHIFYLVALSLYTILLFPNVLAYDRIPHLMVISDTAFVIAHIVLLSDRYARAITAVKQANEELEQRVSERTKELAAANAGLTQTQTAMREMIDSISHDLKTPLTVLGNNLEMLTEVMRLDPEAEGYANVAARKNENLRRLIGNLFAVSRIDARNETLNMESISLPDLFLKLEYHYKDSAGEKGVAFAAPPPLDLTISADMSRLWSVFDNLVYNALRHTDSGGSITVTAASDGGSVNITVADTGCGIATEHLPRIFERFYKVSAARLGNDGTSGLGLYIVKTAMEDMGSTVTVASEEGKGTAFTLTFQC